MTQGVLLSAALHLLVVLFALVGMPHFIDPLPPRDQPIVVEMVELAEITQAPPPAPEPKPEEKPEPPAPEPPQPQPTPPPEPAPEPEPEPVPPEPEPEPEPPPPEPEPAPPEPEPEPQPEPEPEPEPEPAPPPRPKSKPAPPPKPEPEPKAEKKPAPPEDPLASLLASVEELEDKVERRADTAQPRQQGAAAPSLNRSPLAADKPTMSEIDAIRAHVQRHWNIPAGARDATEMSVELEIKVLPNGEVLDVTVVDRARMAGDPFFRSVAESAVRAVRRASPLPIPRDRYESFRRDFTMTFSPRDRLR
ncbi:TonB family protein [Roseospirillum parvum]|uniref:TonB family C-terminal domain-containing protein n=1 Tax=Roseospirillum parvum TaxID=83401 RepID=A0A1G7XNG8_9PROT|nr:TonB family protein [Roseospirillum parvum]SDG85712.1 TonB family C-terminal domain-containing protein [Roseospirillum parvum]